MLINDTHSGTDPALVSCAVLLLLPLLHLLLLLLIVMLPLLRVQHQSYEYRLFFSENRT